MDGTAQSVTTAWRISDNMGKFEYQVVTAGDPERGLRLTLATFTPEQGGEFAARGFAGMLRENDPGIKLEIDFVVTQSEIVRTITHEQKHT